MYSLGLGLSDSSSGSGGHRHRGGSGRIRTGSDLTDDQTQRKEVGPLHLDPRRTPEDDTKDTTRRDLDFSIDPPPPSDFGHGCGSGDGDD